eukprot:COSAG02_NODE_6459_length_3558_cov_2.711477_1_plen_166_part_00
MHVAVRRSPPTLTARAMATATTETTLSTPGSELPLPGLRGCGGAGGCMRKVTAPRASPERAHRVKPGTVRVDPRRTRAYVRPRARSRYPRRRRAPRARSTYRHSRYNSNAYSCKVRPGGRVQQMARARPSCASQGSVLLPHGELQLQLQFITRTNGITVFKSSVC